MRKNYKTFNEGHMIKDVTLSISQTFLCKRVHSGEKEWMKQAVEFTKAKAIECIITDASKIVQLKAQKF